MRILLFITLLLFGTEVCGQSKEGSMLFSTGERPTFLKKYQSRFHLPQDTPWIKGIKKDKKAFYLDQLYASNMIVFGDPVSDYCTKLLNEINPNEYSVYLFRSDKVATFSDSTNIFVTTGLISRLTNEAQLAFFLAREVRVIENQTNPLLEKTESKISIDRMVSELSTYSLEINLLLDQEVYSFLKEKKLYSDSEIISALDVLKYQNRPFYEYSFDINYFNSRHSYIPESKFFILHKPNPEDYDFKSEFPQLLKRINELQAETSNSINFLFDKEDFKNVVNIARHESVVLSVLKANFLKAVYEVYVLEKLGYSSALLDKLKASAWWGFINQEIGSINPKKYTQYEISDSKGATFMRFIRMQPRPAQITIALRTLYDLSLSNPESQAIARMYDDLVLIAAESDDFEIKSFYKTDLLSAIKQFNLKDSLNPKDNELLDIKSQELRAKGVDSVNYHLFMIPDLVKSDVFQEKYDVYKTGSLKPVNQLPSSIAIADFSLVKYKRKKVKQIEDREELLQGAFQTAEEVTDVSISDFSSSEDNYNLSYLINTVFIQNYFYNNYRNKVDSPFSDELSSLMKLTDSEVVGVCVFEHAYEPRYKPFHLLGLLGVTLPYIIPEIFYSGNKTIFSSLYFNADNGVTEGLVYNRFRDPYSNYIIEHSFAESILITYSKDD